MEAVTTGASNQEIFRAIGELTADVKGLRRDFQAGETRQTEHARRADEHRTVIHARVDDMVNEVGALQTRMASMESTVSDSKAVTDEVRKWKLMGIGALAIVGFGGTALGVALAGALDWIGKLIRH